MTEPGPKTKRKVLFLGMGDSARSIVAEYFLRRLDPASKLIGDRRIRARFRQTEAEKRRVLERVAGEIDWRIGLFTGLPTEGLNRLQLEQMTRAIGSA